MIWTSIQKDLLWNKRKSMQFWHFSLVSVILLIQLIIGKLLSADVAVIASELLFLETFSWVFISSFSSFSPELQFLCSAWVISFAYCSINGDEEGRLTKKTDRDRLLKNGFENAHMHVFTRTHTYAHIHTYKSLTFTFTLSPYASRPHLIMIIII